MNQTALLLLLIIVIMLLFGGLAHWRYRRTREYRPRRGLGPIRLLGVLVVLSAVVAGFGFYRGWFHAESVDTDGKRAVTFTVDKDKLNQDKASARQQVQDLGHK